MFQRLLTRLKRTLCLQQQRKEFQPDSFVRLAKVQRWQHEGNGNTSTVEKAVADLKLRPGEKALSLYRLRKEGEIGELACVYSLTLRDNPAHFEYVLFPASVLSGYRVDPVSVPEHPRLLSERHHEIPDPSEEELLRLAERIFGSPGKKVGRITRRQIVDFAVQHSLLETEELRDRIGHTWRKLIEKKKGIP